MQIGISGEYLFGHFSYSEYLNILCPFSDHKESEWNEKRKRYKRIIDVDEGDYGDIGSGQFGEVYRAKVQGTDEVVAVKKVNLTQSKFRHDIAAMTEKIRAERDVMKHLKHRNIVQFIDYYEWTKKRWLCIVMAYYSGGDLGQYISDNGGLTEQVVQTFSGQLKDALLYLRSVSIVHRDLKPENVILSEQSQKAILKIVDFGESKFKLLKCGLTALETKGRGTPIYSPPEMFKKEGDPTTYDSRGILLLSIMLIFVSVFVICYVHLYFMSALFQWISGLSVLQSMRC